MTQNPSPTDELRAAARRLNRRRLLTVTGAAAAIALGTNLPAPGAHAATARHRMRRAAAAIRREPFTLGVASGDPLPDSVVLWTRLAPEPFAPDGGMGVEPVTVTWEVSPDPDFTTLAASGEAVAHPEFHHTVHVEPEGLAPRTDYYYRFRVGDFTSPTGRTRTAPDPAETPERLRFALASCQRYDHGYFTAYRYLAAEEDVDAVVHVGDYIYEYPIDAAAGARAYTEPLPEVFDRELATLEDYRLRYTLYRTDPDLKAAHAAAPWLVTWDDHEVDNNYAAGVSQDVDPTEEFLVRRAAAYRAYYEYMPLRTPQLPDGADLTLHRRLTFGRLAQLDVLDTRQYRSDQAYGDGWDVPGEESQDPRRTMLGAAQERWLADGWAASDATWHLLGQQVMVSRLHLPEKGEGTVNMDAWDGYPAARQRLLEAARTAGVTNLVVLTGDVHVHYACDIKEDFDDPDSRTVGVELVTTSVASGGDGVARPDNWQAVTDANAGHLHLYDGRRGYLLVTLDETQLRADYRVVSHVTTGGGELSTAASLVTRAGEPGLRPAA